MSSRTNLKQQLMREQSELQERKEREQLNISLESSKAVSVPNYTFQAIPSNILTYESRLDHPTCYHITESKNRKVQEFLSQVHRPDNTRPENIHSLPSKFNVVSIEPSPNDLAAVLKNSTANHVKPDEFWDDFKNSTAFSESFADSGVDPSFSPTSETDIIEMFTSLTNGASTSAPCHATINPTEEPAINLTMETFKKERQKKNNHNRIEKNRRCVINEHIKELFVLLPKPQEPLYEIVKDIRQSKGTILKASVDYMKALKEETKKIPKLEEACFTNENIIRKLKLKMQEYEILLTSNGIPIPNPMWQPSTESDIKAIMKQEPHFGSVHEISPIGSAAENNNQVALGIHTTLSQSSRLGKPILQFLTVQDNTASPTKLFKVNDSDNFQICNYPALHTSPIPEELMENNLIANDVLLSSRSGSCTPETMDFLNS